MLTNSILLVVISLNWDQRMDHVLQWGTAAFDSRNLAANDKISSLNETLIHLE